MPKNLTTLFKTEAVAEEQSQLLHLMTLEVPDVPDFTFCDSNDDATYNSVVYSKFPCKFNGVEVTSTGEINKANIQVSNVDRTISSMLENYNGLRGCTLRVKTVFAKFLDTVNTGWKFKNSVCGWGASGATLATGGDGVLVTSTSNDPMFYISNLSFSGATYTKVKVLIKRIAGTSWEGILFYHTTLHGATESYKKIAAQPTYFSDYIELIYDMSQLSNGGDDWVTSTITDLRFDFGSTNQDAFKIAYIIVEDGNGNILEVPNPDASTTSFSEEVYVIDSYTANESSVQFNLEPLIDFSVKLPRRRYTSVCYWRYKDPLTCGYTGELPTCKKDLVDCKAHNNLARFGAFPGVPSHGRRTLYF